MLKFIIIFIILTSSLFAESKNEVVFEIALRQKSNKLISVYLNNRLISEIPSSLTSAKKNISKLFPEFLKQLKEHSTHAPKGEQTLIIFLADDHIPYLYLKLLNIKLHQNKFYNVRLLSKQHIEHEIQVPIVIH